MSQTSSFNPPAIALTIAGSDSGGGAGIQADLKSFSALGVYGASVITAITAQNTCGVSAVHNIPVDVIAAQIKAVLDDLHVAAIKIGMLANPDIIQCVANGIKHFSGPVVLDPVMVAKSGDRLLAADAIDALKCELIPLSTLVTPNIPEAAELLGEEEAEDDVQMQSQGKRICELGARAALMKGGHSKGEICTDWLVNNATNPADMEAVSFSAERINTKNTHGTGCTLSASIAANLAKGQSLQRSVHDAHQYLHRAIVAADKLEVGKGHGPVHHFHQQW